MDVGDASERLLGCAELPGEGRHARGIVEEPSLKGFK